MRKLFTIDDIMIAFVSALGYGFGETISRLFGWPELVCGLASLAVGIILEEIISAIAFSKAVQKKPINRILTYLAFFIIFIIAHSISLMWMGVSMLDYLIEEFVHAVGLPVIGFIISLLIRLYKIWKIKKLYGDGSKGYVFDLKSEDIDEANRQNRQILGEYNSDFAVKTRTGIYVGEKNGKTIDFLGIPYAKPPVGELRWKAPETLPSSDAVFEAKNFGASAIQVDHEGSILKHHRQSEDCLTLNICVASKKIDIKKPVLVLFHHGDFTFGGSADPLLDAVNFISNNPDIIFVSFNYRLGIFGFIDLSEVPGGDAYPDAVNLGLLDQIAALTWLKENISAFGGDPENITVIGFESGAVSISLLAACERAKGLFNRAFIFNGSPAFAYDTTKESKELAKALLNETGAATMQELMQLSTETLKAATQKLWLNICVPVCDGKLIPTNVYQAYQDGAASDIEFIIGVPNNDMQILKSFISNKGYKRYIDRIFENVTELQDYMEESIAKIVQSYIEEQKSASNELEAKSKFIDQWLALSIYHSAAKLSEGGSKVHLIYWYEDALIENLGSGTIDLAASLLGNGEALQLYGSVIDKDLSDTLQSFLHKFVNGSSLQLYSNEIKGVDELDWEPFPKALVIWNGKIILTQAEPDLTYSLWRYKHA